MNLSDYTQEKSVKELMKLYRKGKLLKTESHDKAVIYAYVRSQLGQQLSLSKKDQLRAVVLLDEVNYPVNHVLLSFPKLHPRTLEALEHDRHFTTAAAARYHQSHPIEVLLERAEADKWPKEFFHGLNGHKMSRDLELKLLQLTKRNDLHSLMAHLTVRLDDDEFQEALLEAFDRMTKIGRHSALYKQSWSAKSLAYIQENYKGDFRLTALLCAQKALSEDTALRILGETTTHGIRSALVYRTKHRLIWEQLINRSKALALSGEGNPYFGDNDRAKAYRKAMKGNENGS